MDRLKHGTQTEANEAVVVTNRLEELERENEVLRAATAPKVIDLRYVERPEVHIAPADRPIHYVTDGACYSGVLHKLRANTRNAAAPWGHLILKHADGGLSDKHYSPVPYDERKMEDSWHWPEGCV